MANKIEVNTDEVIEINPDEDGGARYRLPYGIAKGLGLKTDGMTPRQVWDMLKGKGIDPDNEYEKLKEKAMMENVQEEIEEVKIEEFDDSYNDKQKVRVRNFRKDYQKKTHEFGLVLDENGNQFVFREGKTDFVPYFPSEYRQFKQKSLVHNHPQPNTFLSRADIELFMHRELRTIEAVGFDGWTHIVELLPLKNAEMFFGIEKRVMDFANEYKNVLNKAIIKARAEWDNQPKKEVKSGKYLIDVPETWELYRKGASPRDKMNYKEFSKIIQEDLIEFSKNTEKKYGIKSVFNKEE